MIWRNIYVGEINLELLQGYIYANKKDDNWEYKIVKKYNVKFFKGFDYKIVKTYEPKFVKSYECSLE